VEVVPLQSTLPPAHLVERFFSKLKHFRNIVTRYDKRADNFHAMVKLASVRLELCA